MTTSGTAIVVVDVDGNTPAPKKIKVSARGTRTHGSLLLRPARLGPAEVTDDELQRHDLTDKTNEFLIAYNTGMTTAKSFGTAGTKMSTGEYKATPLFPFSSSDVSTRAPAPPMTRSQERHRQRPGPGQRECGHPDDHPALATADDHEDGKRGQRQERSKDLQRRAVKVTDTELRSGRHQCISQLDHATAPGPVEEKQLGLPWSKYEVCASGSVTTGPNRIRTPRSDTRPKRSPSTIRSTRRHRNRSSSQEGTCP